MQLLEQIEHKILNPNIKHKKLYFNGHQIRVGANHNKGLYRVIKTKLEKNLEYKCCECQSTVVSFKYIPDGTPKLVGGIKLMCSNGQPLTIDHIKPTSKGGLDEVENYQLMCQNCNSIKSSYANNKVVRKVQRTSDIFKIKLNRLKKPGKLKGVLMYHFFKIRKKLKIVLYKTPMLVTI